MDDVGTVRIHTGTSDPYIHTSASAQLLPALHVSLRQSGSISGLFDDAARLYPGMDFKLRLLRENAYRPEISLGLVSAFGHKRMASEYVVMSKRYKNFDLTGGMAWGRLGSAAHFSNPLKAIHNHFGKKRGFDGEMPHDMQDWFTGEDIGLFAGIEYYTPLDGLSLKADWGADRYIIEAAQKGFETPNPWSLGLHYRPHQSVSVGGALVGGNKIMGTFSLQSPFTKWPKSFYQNRTKPNIKGNLKRPPNGDINMVARAAQLSPLRLRNIEQSPLHTPAQTSATLSLNPAFNAPAQIMHAAQIMATSAAPSVESIRITPSLTGLEGQQIQINRRDIEAAFFQGRGSPAEIWNNIHFAKAPPDNSSLWGRFLGWGEHRFE